MQVGIHRRDSAEPPLRGGHPHQSKIGSEEPIFDSFSLEGEAFGGYGTTASPPGEKLSVPGSSEPGTD